MTKNKLPLAVTVLLIVLFLAAGTLQTLLLKWADHLSSPDNLESRYYGQRSPNTMSNVSSALFASPSEAQQSTQEQSAMKSAYYMSLNFVYSFGHPFVQTFFMFCGECVCLLAFAAIVVYKLWTTPVQSERQNFIFGKLMPGEYISLPCNPCLWILTSGADFIGSVMQNAGLLLTTASVYQMLRGATVLWVALISYFWFNRRYTKVEQWGIAIVIIGLTIVGLSSFVDKPDISGSSSADATSTPAPEQHSSTEALFGNVLVILAQVSHAYQGVCQERLITLYKVPPLQMVGMDGFYGVQMTLILLALQLYVPVSLWSKNIVEIRESIHHYFAPIFSTHGSVDINAYSNITVVPITHTTSTTYTTGLSSILSQLPASPSRVPYDDVILAFTQMSVTMSCAICIISYIASCVVYNVTLMLLIEHLNVVAAVMIGSLRNISVWIICLLMPGIFHEKFNFLQLIGFIFLVAGNVLYQRVWITRFHQILPHSVVDACPWLFRDAAPVTVEDVNTDTIHINSHAHNNINILHPEGDTFSKTS